MSRLDKNLIFCLIMCVAIFITLFIIKPLNVLVLGIDQLGRLGNEVGEVGYNGQADFVAIVHVDLLMGDLKVVTIPRETMVDIESDYLLDENGKKHKQNKQLCLQFAYATTSREGAELMQKCLKDNFGVNTDCFIACSMGAVPSIVDMFGGVDITASRDYSYGSESIDDWVYLSKGETVHYDGNASYDFVHFRDIENVGTNQDRMERQKDFIKAFREKIKISNLLNVNSLRFLTEIYTNYIKTNITELDIVKLLFAYEIFGLDEDDIIRVDGTETHPGIYDEFEISEKGYQLLDEL